LKAFKDEVGKAKAKVREGVSKLNPNGANVVKGDCLKANTFRKRGVLERGKLFWKRDWGEKKFAVHRDERWKGKRGKRTKIERCLKP